MEIKIMNKEQVLDEIKDLVDSATSKFGIYALFDKGPYEVMDFDVVVNFLELSSRDEQEYIIDKLQNWRSEDGVGKYIASYLSGIFGHEDLESTQDPIDNVGIMNAFDLANSIEEENPKDPDFKPGKYKPKKKFLGFISGTGANIRILTDVAKIDGKILSGTLEGCQFELKVHPDGSVDFDQISGESVGEEMIMRLLDEIAESDATGYFGKSVISGYNFKNSEGILCYLEVEYEKPIEKLAKLFEMENKKPSQKALDILNSLFGDSEDESTSDQDSVEPDPVKSNIGVTNEMLEESFNKMNSEKIAELESRIERTQNEITKVKFEVKNGESKLQKLSDEFKVLNSRLKSMKPGDQPNGWTFNVSEKIENDIQMSQETLDIIEKVSKVLNLVPEKVQKVIADGYFNINFSSESGEESMPIEMIKKISNLDPLGSLSKVSDFEFRYSGELNWHEIVDTLVKMGFKKV